MWSPTISQNVADFCLKNGNVINSKIKWASKPSRLTGSHHTLCPVTSSWESRLMHELIIIQLTSYFGVQQGRLWPDSANMFLMATWLYFQLTTLTFKFQPWQQFPTSFAAPASCFQHLLRFKKQSSCSDFLTVVCRKPKKRLRWSSVFCRLFSPQAWSATTTALNINKLYMKIHNCSDLHIHDHKCRCDISVYPDVDFYWSWKCFCRIKVWPYRQRWRDLRSLQGGPSGNS